MLTFMCATYNEEDQVSDLLKDMAPYVDAIRVCDDGSTDRTQQILKMWKDRRPYFFDYKVIEHTGLPETVKAAALEMVPDNSWVIMLDCDESFPYETMKNIMEFILNEEASKDYTHMYFHMEEYIDARLTRQFEKCRLFRKEAAHFSTSIHEDERFDGNGVNYHWKVLHNKTSNKQIKREMEYLATYQKLLSEGKITEDRFRWLTSLHYFVRPHG